MEEVKFAALEALVARWVDLRVLVVGDLILDEYRLGEVERVSPEAPVPVVRVASVDEALGGAGNVARNIVSLGASSDLVGVVGEDPEAETFRRRLAGIGLDDSGVVACPDRPTTHKLRVVSGSRQLLRIDREERGELPEEVLEAVAASARDRLPASDVVVLADYDKGLFRSGLGAGLIALARDAGCEVVADPKTDLCRFRGAALVKPNWVEATRGVDPPPGSPETRRSLLEKWRAELGGAVVVTRGGQGISAIDAEGRYWEVPARRLAVYDVQGAGDTAAAALALARAAGASLVEACIVANAAGSVAVGKVGTAAVSADELVARLPEAFDVWREARAIGGTA